jgi:2-polyprenyl-3-methyl-5-hydroxy-6-metoxy-1,4-benzoquinol methylase
VDHEAQSAGDYPVIIELLKNHDARPPILEVGCATGGLLSALDGVGLLSFGLDVSEWAVARAAERVGPSRAWVCDIDDHTALPPEVIARGPFGALVLSAVFEHLSDPFAVLERLGRLTVHGTVLVITTSNSDSFTHGLLGLQWEGYFDWTHKGVDKVSVESLREELPKLGWRILELSTHLVWDGDADPTRATLREWWVADARFRRLLVERNLGDMITCVAVKE